MINIHHFTSSLWSTIVICGILLKRLRMKRGDVIKAFMCNFILVSPPPVQKLGHKLAPKFHFLIQRQTAIQVIHPCSMVSHNQCLEEECVISTKHDVLVSKEWHHSIQWIHVRLSKSVINCSMREACVDLYVFVYVQVVYKCDRLTYWSTQQLDFTRLLTLKHPLIGQASCVASLAIAVDPLRLWPRYSIRVVNHLEVCHLHKITQIRNPPPLLLIKILIKIHNLVWILKKSHHLHD